MPALRARCAAPGLQRVLPLSPLSAVRAKFSPFLQEGTASFLSPLLFPCRAVLRTGAVFSVRTGLPMGGSGAGAALRRGRATSRMG